MTLTKNWRGLGTDLFQTPIPVLDLAQPTIPFKRLPLPESSLTFLPRSSLSYSRKRGRAAADIDGEHSCMQKKKRRLRLFLITSRLSPQFSHPATNIVDRGSSKIAVWAKQKAMGRNLLPKAAILNRIRRGAVAARDAVSRRRLLVEQDKEQQQLEMARLTFNYGAIHTYTRPVHLPTEPIPAATAVRDANHHLISGSLSVSTFGSPATSRSPSPTSIPSLLNGPGNDASSDCTSPNAAFAFSPPRVQSSLRTYEPHLPSPLGLSNYDAFDVEDLDTKTKAPIDLYSHLDDDDDDDDDEEDRYSFFWTQDEDDRHDSPFSAHELTSDSRSTADTGPSQDLQTPPQQARDSLDEPDATSSLLGGLSNGTSLADAVWPTSVPGKAGKKAAPRALGCGVARSRCAPFDAGPLAVQYPGAPVPFEEQRPVATAPALKPEMVPASMSPNFLAADLVGWEWDREGK